MKTIEELVKIIEEKQTEHAVIAKQIAGDVEILRQRMAEMIQAKAAKDSLMTQTNAMMVLKDRMMFHKAALLVYKDLLEEIKK